MLWAVAATVTTGAVVVSTTMIGRLSSFVGGTLGLATARSHHSAEVEAERQKTLRAGQDARQARAEASQAKAEARRRQIDRDAGRSRNSQLGQENDRLRREREVHDRGKTMKASEAAERITSRAVRSTARATASIHGEALPFLGTAVVVASLGLDHYDACETTKDMHEPDMAFNPDNANDERKVCGMRAPTAANVWQVMLASPGAAWEEAVAYRGQLEDHDVSAPLERRSGTPEWFGGWWATWLGEPSPWHRSAGRPLRRNLPATRRRAPVSRRSPFALQRPRRRDGAARRTRPANGSRSPV